MKKYQIRGGGFISSDNNFDLIERIRENSFYPGRSIDEFIKETSKACKIQTGALIRTDNLKIFVEDLIKNEFIKEVKDD